MERRAAVAAARAAEAEAEVQAAEEEAAARTLQRQARRHQDAVRARREQEEHEARIKQKQKEYAAASRIKAHYRGYRARAAHRWKVVERTQSCLVEKQLSSVRLIQSLARQRIWGPVIRSTSAQAVASSAPPSVADPSQN